MFLQHTSRSPRTNAGLKVKHVFQIAFMLALGIWLLYQASQSQIKNSDSDGDTGDKIRKLLGSGWKEKVGYNGGLELEASNKAFEDVVEKEDSERKDDVLDQHSEEKVEDEASNKEDEDLEENTSLEREGEAETEPKNQPEGDEESSGDDQMKSEDEGEVLDKDNADEQQAERKEENQDKEEKGKEIATEGSKTNGTEEMEASDKDTHEANDISDQSEGMNDTQEFADENGIPKEDHESSVRSRDNETRTIHQEASSDQGTRSNLDIESERGETVVPGSSNSSAAGKQNEGQTDEQPIEDEEVATQEGKHASKEDTPTNGSSDGSKRETGVGEEINQTSETEEVDRTDSASISAVSQKAKEEEPDLKTRLETEDERKNKELPSHQMT